MRRSSKEIFKSRHLLIKVKEENDIYAVKQILKAYEYFITKKVEVDLVILDEEINVEIDADDLRIDTYRSSGAGGQHVNKTDSAIRITHLPTGIVVTCQNERSQHQNKDMAMKILMAKLTELAEQEHKENLKELKGDYSMNTWGSQIRSYVFQPYTMVKDHRTGAETANVTAVMDGDLDYFINEKLKKKD